MVKRLVWDARACTHCLACAEVCPTDALPIVFNRLQPPDHARCVLCGRCVAECPEDAFTL